MTDVAKLRSEALKDAPRNCWVAFAEETIVAHGATYKEAVQNSASLGIKDPVIVKTPKDRLPTCF